MTVCHFVCSNEVVSTIASEGLILSDLLIYRINWPVVNFFT
jgi:hypothetical protein